MTDRADQAGCRRGRIALAAVGVVALLAASCSSSSDANAKPKTPTSTATRPSTSAIPGPSSVATPPGVAPVVNPVNLYSETGPGKLSAAVRGDLPRVYVPNRADSSVSVIDPATMKVIDTFPVGLYPQHIVPSWDLQTLWVTNNAEGTDQGSVTTIDPRTGKAGEPIKVEDPYNMYFTPDGKSAIVVAEALHRLDFRDPHTMQMQSSIDVPGCDGVNHADFTIDSRFVIFTCEFNGGLVKVDLTKKAVAGYLKLSGQDGMPQDIRSSPDGRIFYVADMMAGGVYLIDPTAFTETGFVPTGIGTHGLYPSRDGKQLYIANRGSNHVAGNTPHNPGSVSVLDFATGKVVANWPIPAGGSPDMGNVSVDGSRLWLSGRYDNEVYSINTKDGSVVKIPVGSEPHGLTVWPQPGRYSLGHTGNMR